MISASPEDKLIDLAKAVKDLVMDKPKFPWLE